MVPHLVTREGQFVWLVNAESSDHASAAAGSSASVLVHRNVLHLRGVVGEEFVDEFHFCEGTLGLGQ